MKSNIPVEDRIIKAKVSIREKQPFFSYLLLHLKIERDDRVGTCCVNKDGYMRYSEKWFNTLEDEQIVTVLTHEILHVVYLHMTRLRGRKHSIFNIATDAAINNILVNNGFIFPKDGIIPQNNILTIKQKINDIIVTDLDKKIAEQIYDEIYSKFEEGEGKGRGKGKGGVPGNGDGDSEEENQEDENPNGFDKHIFSDSENEVDDRKTEKKWKEIIVNALNISKLQGKVPLGMERLIGELLNEKVNWKVMLYRFITNQLPYDYTWKKPMKKSYSLGVYFPDIKKEMLEVVVAIDTSGSIGQKELSEFLTEIVGIAKSFANIKMTVMECDCEVHQVFEVRNGDIPKILSMKVKGGGGTSHRPVFSYIKENISDCKVLVCLTDGYSDINACKEPEYPVLWVLSENSVPENSIPFGTTIKM